MNQRYFSYGLLTLVLFSVVVLPGCGGGGDDAPEVDTKVASIDVSPASLSMEFGQVVALSPSAKNAAGEVLVQTFTFKSENTAVVTIANNGTVCAGTWDSVTNPIVCTPATTPGSTTITVTSSGVSKSVPVNTHRRIASVQITSTAVPCTSSTKTQQFTAKAFAADGSDITSTVGAPSWVSTDTNIATLDANGLATAKKPGRTTINAVINNVISVPVPMITCPPASITIKEKDSNPAVTALTIDVAASKTLAAVVVDTLGVTITDLTLTWSTSRAGVATATSTGVVNGIAPGFAGVIASCTPPTCNAGLTTPVYSNLVTVAVNGSSASPAYATAKNATTIVPINADNSLGTAITIPTLTVNNATVNPVVNSFVFNHDGNQAYLGTDRGMVTLVTATNTVSLNQNLPGKVLAVSPDSLFVAVADTSVVRLFSLANSNFTAINAAGATAAHFSPDSSKLFLAAGPTLYEYSLVGGLRTLPVGSAINDVTVLTQGNYTYLAGDVGSTIATRATCDASPLVALATAQKPLLIESTYDSTHVYATEGANVYDVSVTTGTAPCPPPAPVQSLTTTAYGVAVTPGELLVHPNGSRVYLTNNTPQILVYGPTTGVSTLNLVGGATASTTGGLTSDGKSLYVGAVGSNDVQKFDTTTGIATQIAVNLRNSSNATVAPDFVVVRTR